jgi:DNA-binding response OmpR family regulator
MKTDVPLPRRVLVADPDADTRAVCATACAAERWDVIEAVDGGDALLKALIRTPSLVVTELHLPLIDGVSLCTLLRRDRATTNVPIAILAARAEPGEAARALSAGADVVFTKPPCADGLIGDLQRLMSRTFGRPCPKCRGPMAFDRRPDDMMFAGGPIWICTNPSCRHTAFAS